MVSEVEINPLFMYFSLELLSKGNTEALLVEVSLPNAVLSSEGNT